MQHYITLNGKYLSNLFEDDVSKMFRADRPTPGIAYYYCSLETAKTIANNLGATVHSVPDMRLKIK